MATRHPAPVSLAGVAAGYKRGEATAEQLFTAFLGARLYSPAPPRPGVHVLRVGERQVVPVFSSETELAAFAGRARWFSTLGVDLLGLLPEGVALGLDLASAHRLELDPAAARLVGTNGPGTA